MTRFDANEPAQRRALAAEAVIAHRKRASEAAVFEVYPGSDANGRAEEPGSGGGVDGASQDTDRDAGVGGDTRELLRLVYAQGVITVECTPDERERLDALLKDFPVFKLQQPETRKAPDGTVHVSAVADPKHAADFLDAAFRQVYDQPEEYRLWIAQV